VQSIDSSRPLGARLRRRDVLAAGSLLALSRLLPQATAFAQAPPIVEVGPIPMGFVDGSDQWEHLFGFPRWSRRAGFVRGPIAVTPASELPLGDQSLADGFVWLRAAGLYPDLGPHGDPSLLLARLTVLFPADDPLVPGPFPFYAWEARTFPGRCVAAPVGFVVPVGLFGEVTLVWEVLTRDLASGRRGQLAHRRLESTFTVDWDAGRPKLQRGVYLLGCDRRSWARTTALPAPKQAERRGLRSLVLTVEPITDEA
jgi:hypothetical protein